MPRLPMDFYNFDHNWFLTNIPIFGHTSYLRLCFWLVTKTGNLYNKFMLLERTVLFIELLIKYLIWQIVDINELVRK